jgi:SAM-dependent methyltransferase
MASEYSQDSDMVAHYMVGDEQSRLNNGGARLEYLRTQELLARYLQPSPAIIADIGGGSGAYALPLAKQGYEVHLVDPIPLHIEQANVGSTMQPQAPLASATVGDARGLSFNDASVDAVLLLGPLYHLTERNDRIKALQEACRVVRPGGVVLAAAISRFTSAIDGMHRRLIEDAQFEAMIERDLQDGQHRNPTGNPDWFTTAYFHLPGALEVECSEAGLIIQTSVAVEGPGWMLAGLDDWLDDPMRRSKLLDTLRMIEAQPSLMGVSSHFIVIGVKPG